MNQILNQYESNNINDFHYPKRPNPTLLKTVFIASIFLIIACILYFMHIMYVDQKNETLSKQMLDNFNITTLYASSNNYQTNLSNHSQNPFVIGMIEIPSIDLHYPILSEITEENLKIAPCRFYGALPNQIGNLCIAGHNYRNHKFFSQLDTLNIEDNIHIYDTTGSKVTYAIYDKYVTDSSYLSCTSQNTNGEKEITLVTCNKPDNTKRIIIKAKEKK